MMSRQYPEEQTTVKAAEKRGTIKEAVIKLGDLTERNRVAAWDIRRELIGEIQVPPREDRPVDGLGDAVAELLAAAGQTHEVLMETLERLG